MSHEFIKSEDLAETEQSFDYIHTTPGVDTKVSKALAHRENTGHVRLARTSCSLARLKSEW